MIGEVVEGLYKTKDGIAEQIKYDGIERAIGIVTREKKVKVLTEKGNRYKVQIGDVVYGVLVKDCEIKTIKNRGKVYYDSNGVDWEK